MNGLNITLKEFKARLPEQRAETMTYFEQTYGCDSGGADFWISSCGGQIPLNKLKETTLGRLVEDRVREAAARTAGLYAADGYDAFLADWAEENRERARRIAAGEVIYGPRAFTEQAYYRYVASNTVLGLKQWLEESGEPPTEEQLRKEYAETTAGISNPPSYEEAKGDLIRIWADNRYDSWFQAKLKQAVVTVNEQIYENIAM